MIDVRRLILAFVCGIFTLLAVGAFAAPAHGVQPPSASAVQTAGVVAAAASPVTAAFPARPAGPPSR